ncbi:thiamine-phosphate kinase [Tundrisphaera sp. TA3]|uniref:thiamine-phosphate kinase n=1 Tax=Tundrisphaera sp. TA3 TaxID=3435775 RepID=UPI003EBCC64B
MTSPDPTQTEFGLIAWIRDKARGGERVAAGIGDDCAGLRLTPGAEVLVTTDMLMDGRHFILKDSSPEEVGYKAMAVNLSDVAAMAGIPVAAFVSVALPRGSAVEVGQGLIAGMMPLADRFGVALAGGDTNAWDGPLVVSVTVVGEATGRGPVRRSGAQPGDAILVTGALGGSLRGRHLRPEPRVAEALALHERAPLRAMIDISDGLASDLGHILEESGNLGATLIADRVPIHQDAHTRARRTSRPSLDHALNDGEDFELCFTLDPEAAEALMAEPPPGVALSRIGTVEESPGLRLLRPDGKVVDLAAKGFDHFADAEAPAF